MNKKKILYPLAITTLLFLALVFFRAWQSWSSKNGKNHNEAEAKISVEAAAVKTGDLSSRLTLTGDLAPAKEVTVVSKSSGKLEQVLVDRGAWVKRDQLLTVVEHRELELKVAELAAAYGMAQAFLAQSRANFELAQSDQKRLSRLFEEGAISAQQRDEVNARLASNFANHQLALHQLDLAKSAWDLAKKNLEDTRITAPQAGYIVKRFLDPGGYTSPGQPLFVIHDLGQLKVLVGVMQQDLPKIRQGMAVKIKVDAYPQDIFMGRVSLIAPSLERQSRAAEIEVTIPNQDLRLRPGMFTTIEIETGKFENELLIPAKAVISQEGKSYIYLIKEGKARMQPVSLGEGDGQWFIVREGLKAGDKVVTLGKENLREGIEVAETILK